MNAYLLTFWIKDTEGNERDIAHVVSDNIPRIGESVSFDSHKHRGSVKEYVQKKRDEASALGRLKVVDVWHDYEFHQGHEKDAPHLKNTMGTRIGQDDERVDVYVEQVKE